MVQVLAMVLVVLVVVVVVVVVVVGVVVAVVVVVVVVVVAVINVKTVFVGRGGVVDELCCKTSQFCHRRKTRKKTMPDFNAATDKQLILFFPDDDDEYEVLQTNRVLVIVPLCCLQDYISEKEHLSPCSLASVMLVD